MSFVMHILNWLYDVFQSWPAPALQQMRLGPEESLDNPLMMQFFTWDAKKDGSSWWKHLKNEIPRLAELGVTQLWLPPPNKAMVPQGRGYDAYDLWDLGEFDQKGSIGTRWGTKDELLQACATARRCRIDILIDAVLNHKLGADSLETFTAVPVDPQNRLKDLDKPREIDGWTAFKFPGRGEKYSSLHWSQQHFTGLDWDHRTKTKGVYRITGDGHKGWSHHVDNELGNYDYLLGIDIDHRHPEVREDLFAWGPWVIETTGGAGFRLDAIKHMDRQFLLDFLINTRERIGRPNMFAVAEYWSANLRLILPYIRAFQGQTAFFDVPLHDNFHQASKRGPEYDLRTILDNTLVKARPGDAVTFVDNHDTVVGQSLESWVDKNFKIQAYALILLRDGGYPCIFYGDLYPNKEGYDEVIARDLERLVLARKMFAYGTMTDYFVDRNCIGFVRAGNSAHSGCAVVLSNGRATDSSSTSLHSIRMNVGIENGSCTYYNYLIPQERVEISEDGWYAFTCPPGRVQVWVTCAEWTC